MFFALFKEIRQGVNSVHDELTFCLPKIILNGVTAHNF